MPLPFGPPAMAQQQDSQPKPVQSTWVADIQYSNGVLVVRTRTGKVYSYFGIPEALWMQLQAATSKGSFINAHIKGKYPER